MSNYKLGRLPARLDERTIQLKKLLIPEKLPALPDSYDVQTALDVVDMNDDGNAGNPAYGNCVVAASTHMTRCFEKFETGLIPNLPREDIIAQYLKETGGSDTGLVELDHLNLWRQEGLYLGGKNYKIDAYAAVDSKDHNELKYCTHLLRGVYSGFLVPQSALDQYDQGKIWDVVPNDGGIVGGHAVYIIGYNAVGPICMTWGRRQPMTWPFHDKYFDEDWGIIDAMNYWLDPAVSPLDLPLLRSILTEITGNPIPGPAPDIPRIRLTPLPIGTIGEDYEYQLEATGGIPPYYWSTDGGTGNILPFGLYLTSDGRIKGKPEGAFTADITFYCRDDQPLTSAWKTRLIVTDKKPLCPIKLQARERNKKLGIGG